MAFVNLRYFLNLKSALYRVIICYKRQHKFVYLLFVLRHWQRKIKRDHKRNYVEIQYVCEESGQADVSGIAVLSTYEYQCNRRG